LITSAAKRAVVEKREHHPQPAAVAENNKLAQALFECLRIVFPNDEGQDDAQAVEAGVLSEREFLVHFRLVEVVGIHISV
jgi:hypothetical protein